MEISSCLPRVGKETLFRVHPCSQRYELNGAKETNNTERKEENGEVDATLQPILVMTVFDQASCHAYVVKKMLFEFILAANGVD